MVDDGIVMTREDYDTLYQFRSIVEKLLDERIAANVSRDKIESELKGYFPNNYEWVKIILSEHDKGIRLTEHT